MNFLEKITTGKIKRPYQLVLYGTPKTGKTTWAAESESPVFMDIEEGSAELDVARLPRPESFQEALQIIRALIDGNHSYKTLVIDSLDHLETLCNSETAKENGVTSVGEIGFGKGYAQSLAKWQKLYELLSELQRKMNIIGIAHSSLKKIDDPTKASAYDKHDLKLRDAIGSLSKEKADAILFAVFEVHVVKDRSGKGKASGDGSRVLYTQGRPAHEGGNRFNLPYMLPLCFEDFLKAMNEPDSPEKLIERIKEECESVTDESLKEKVLASMKMAKKDTTKLTKILDRLETILSQKVA